MNEVAEGINKSGADVVPWIASGLIARAEDYTHYPERLMKAVQTAVWYPFRHNF
jgi:hypothetical protein